MCQRSSIFLEASDGKETSGDSRFHLQITTIDKTMQKERWPEPELEPFWNSLRSQK